MKRILALMLALMLAVSMGACGMTKTEKPEMPLESARQPLLEEKPETVDTGIEKLASLRQTMTREGYACAVAYLGYYGEDYDALARYLQDGGFLEDYPYLEGIPRQRYVETEGDELYLLVPAEAAAELRICDWVIDESNDYEGAAGEQVFFRGKTGEPILLKCNLSDIMPNALVVIGELEYSPALSGMDGSLILPETWEPGFGILDITRQAPEEQVCEE